MGFVTLTQSSPSRFFSNNLNWQEQSLDRIKSFCSTPEIAINDGDVIALDDTKIEHPYGKKLPFLCWLYDNSEKKHLWCMNLVSTLLVRANGLITPLAWRIWVQDRVNKAQSKGTKLELAKEMLLSLREVSSARLWIAMDRWFLCKEFFQWLNTNGFDWVTKCKKNTALFEMTCDTWNVSPRYSPVNPAKLLAQVYSKLIDSGKPGEIASISIPDIYIKLPEWRPNKKGKLIKKQIYTPVAAIATVRLPEDMENGEPVVLDLGTPDEKAAHFKGSYLLISNRVDAPESHMLRGGKSKYFTEMQSRS